MRRAGVSDALWFLRGVRTVEERRASAFRSMILSVDRQAVLEDLVLPIAWWRL